MRNLNLALLFCLVTLYASGQEPISPFDGRYWGLVLEHPGTKNIVVKQNIAYTKIGDRQLHIDVYQQPGSKTTEVRPTIVLLNGIGDQPGQPTSKESPSQTSWARMLAANGYVVVTMETEVNKIQESFIALFKYIDEQGQKLGIDKNVIGVQAFSANCRESVAYAMSDRAFPGIKAATFYYGEAPPGPFRDDLPVLFVVAELDIRSTNYSKLWQDVVSTYAPWTITLAKDMPHAFDVFSDTETSRRVIMSTISFWNDQLKKIQAGQNAFSKEREIVASRYDRDQSRLLKLMGEWVKEHPDTKDRYALGLYGTALMENKEYAQAEIHLKKSVALNPSDKGQYLTLATVLYAQGKVKEGDDAIAVYEKGSTPEGFTYWFIANRLIDVPKYKEAVILYERAVAFTDHGPWMYYNMAASYAALGEKEKAFTNLSKSIEKGYGVKKDYEGDERFKDLRGDNRWNELVSRLSE